MSTPRSGWPLARIPAETAAPGRPLRLFSSATPLHPPLYEKKGRSGGRKSEVEGKGRSRRDPAGRVPRRGGGSRGTLPRRNCLRLLCGWSAVAVGRMGLLGRSGAGTCPNLLQRRPGPGSAARRSAEYQRFSSGALTRSGPLQQIWTTRRPDPPGGAPRAAARGRRGPAFRAPGGARTTKTMVAVVVQPLRAPRAAPTRCRRRGTHRTSRAIAHMS